jgi:hypothetical protein
MAVCYRGADFKPAGGAGAGIELVPVFWLLCGNGRRANAAASML